MQCKKCSQPAVFSNPGLCRKHFVSYVEQKVMATIKRHKLLNNQDKIVVAASGGKDSTACLHIINKHFGDVTALAIDEGIEGYREHTLKDLERFCKKHGILLKIYGANALFGKTLDSLVKQGSHACSVCGAMRRQIINSKAKALGATVVATGHNMDDEAQSIMMNLFRNNLPMSARQGPKTGTVRTKGFVTRIKPLYFCSEKEMTAYAHLMDFGIGFAECPYAQSSYRRYVQQMLNGYEQTHPGTKRNIINNFLEILPGLREAYSRGGSPGECELCGEPSAGKICNVCKTFK